MTFQNGAMTPTRRDLNDPRSSGSRVGAPPRTPVLNDRRSTR